MMLAQTYCAQDVAGWWLSEKLDGCRAFWDGACLRTRDSWKAIDAPGAITTLLPAGIALDGELWAGYGTLGTVSSLVRFASSDDPRWAQVRFMVFDAPTTDSEAFEDRLAFARGAARGTQVGFVEQRRVESAGAALAEMVRVVSAGGEGVVLRAPGHVYEFGRSRHWLKMKPGEGA